MWMNDAVVVSVSSHMFNPHSLSRLKSPPALPPGAPAHPCSCLSTRGYLDLLTRLGSVAEAALWLVTMEIQC